MAQGPTYSRRGNGDRMGDIISTGIYEPYVRKPRKRVPEESHLQLSEVRIIVPADPVKLAAYKESEEYKSIKKREQQLDMFAAKRFKAKQERLDRELEAEMLELRE